MFFFASLLLITSTFQSSLSADLCQPKEWFNDVTGECLPCRVCHEKAFELSPCLKLSNTLCVNMVDVRHTMDPSAALKYRHKWHETEGIDLINVKYAEEKKFMPSKSNSDSEDSSYDNLWSQAICVLLSLTVIALALSVVLMTLRYFRKSFAAENRNIARSRLFSRDRLNTTEYMNNLATLDRRLAIDEILEKRKRAIFEPQLLHENIYTDEVFIDLSGVPRNLRDDHPYEELDLRKCLLQMKDKQ